MMFNISPKITSFSSAIAFNENIEKGENRSRSFLAILITCKNFENTGILDRLTFETFKTYTIKFSVIFSLLFQRNDVSYLIWLYGGFFTKF